MKNLTVLFCWAVGWLLQPAAFAVTNSFFSGVPMPAVMTSNINSITLNSGNYLFTYTVDGYWSAYPGGPPTGRFFSAFWTNGIHAQAITAGPNLGGGADIIIERVDGQAFDLPAFTGKLLANTAGTGGAFELMPLLDGEDALNDPLLFDCSGNGGQSFSHTPRLVGYEAYKIHLWVDWALTALTLVDADPVPPPVIVTPELSIQLTHTNTALLSWPTNAVGFGLQWNADVTTINWLTVTNAVGIVGTNNQVVRALSAEREFFRLRKL